MLQENGGVIAIEGLAKSLLNLVLAEQFENWLGFADAIFDKGVLINTGKVRMGMLGIEIKFFQEFDDGFVPFQLIFE